MQGLLDNFLKDGYKYEIKKAELRQETGVLSLYITSNFIVPYEDLDGIRNKIIAEVPGLTDAKFIFKFEDMIHSQDEIIRSFLMYMKSTMPDNPWVKTIKDNKFEIEEGVLRIYVIGQQVEENLNEQASARFAKLLNNFFGYDLKVVFVNSEDDYKQTQDDMEKSFNEPPAPVTYSTSGRLDKPQSGGFGGGYGGYKKKRAPRSIFGRGVSHDAKPLKSISGPEDNVLIKGEIFFIEDRDIKNDRKIVTLYLSDATSSMCCKFFCEADQWEEYSAKLSVGTYIYAKGNVEFDSFANSLAIMLQDVEIGEKEVRMDNAPEKRIELHAHTNMSAMDGISNPKELVKTAKKWGHEAIAITDHGVVQSFPDAYGAGGDDIKVILGVEGYLFVDDDFDGPKEDIPYKSKGTHHIIILAKNKEGLRHLYELISESHMNYFYKKPRMPRSIIEEKREGLIIGSACVAGEFFNAIIEGKSDEELDRIAAFYDYLEIQPLSNNGFLKRNGTARDDEDLRNYNRKVVEVARRLGKPCCATCDTHYINEEDAIFRSVLQAGQGYEKFDNTENLYFRTTEEMLAEFSYLGEETAYEVVVTNPKIIADMIESIPPVPSEKCPPTIANAEQILRDICDKNITEKYGENPPEFIKNRLDKELNSIIGNGYAVMYVSAKMLVDKSNSDGYLVGSRGSVGSSFAATMSGITEVNPLPPHYVCPNCKQVIWGDEQNYDCGCDMPEMMCPDCGTPMSREGFTIPFETFLGFEGDKEPDIDLNFAGEYQPRAHKYVDEIFGAKNVYKAGTIGTVAQKTGFGFAKKYAEATGQNINRYEMERLANGVVGVKRTTGQHPGGIVIVPDDRDIHEFCPTNHPANDASTGIRTTHFDYHKIDQNLLKLDILGHDVPSMIRQLEDLTGTDPKKVDFSDPETMSIFNGTQALNILYDDYEFTHGSYGIPEFGTKFVRQMLDDTHPETFSALARISGFSHGTNVWLGNAQEFIRSGDATMKEAISTRDDIMNYLILKGLPNAQAFQIMEKVRKGKGVAEDKEALMREHEVPDWYIESCKRISYMFPRAHAVAYTMMSFRIAYYKVHYPAAFYATYLTTKVQDFNWNVIKQGRDAVLQRMKEIELMGNNASKKEQDEILVYEICYEMYSRGLEFEAPSFEHSKAAKFWLHDGKVVVPFCGLEGLGESAAKQLVEAYAERPFETIEEMQIRARTNKTGIEALREAGVLDGMPESDQLSLF